MDELADPASLSRSARGGHADRFWAIGLACQKERGPGPAKGVEIGVRVLG